ncbi:hypothetical protein [Streptomyces sp. S.PNR 29]|uniref:hypothetical protein n=1 Tax=Streptomyces sp. S.PNR 29 TaxID=2973805 RepID=UPI0025B20B6A|nr:hypothetical protein [Streptomyces sp. S.PNR 29]MDN0200713.1 hypothetical protein [Streptomyces sp. S.PNR 29]
MLRSLRDRAALKGSLCCYEIAGLVSVGVTVMRIRKRISRIATVTTTAVTLVGGLVASPASAGSTKGLEFQDIPCNSLQGSGTYSDPLRLGSVGRPIFLSECPPLRSGVGYNVRYFSFEYEQNPSQDSFAGTFYMVSGTGASGVHPRMSLNGVTMRHSLDAKFTRLGDLEGFAHATAGLPAEGTWRLGAEKLSSPLGSLVTEEFNVVIVP